MGKIQVKFDNQLTQSDIVLQLRSSSEDEMGDSYEKNQTELLQTAVYGIQVPLIAINGIAITFQDIISFNLESTGVLPTVSMKVKDRYNLISTFNSPGIDNELRVQILPQFENIYKKINLTFFITNINISGDSISLSAEYKLPDFVASRLKSFGEINTYGLFEAIAQETKLGFATNIEPNDTDKRYIYCAYQSYEDILAKEINYSGYDVQILDYWIDLWNNLVLADVYDRYNTIENEDDMKIYISGQKYEMTEGVSVDPIEVSAVLSNHPDVMNQELYVSGYKLTNNPGEGSLEGTDRLYSIYEMDKKEYLDYMIQDGDVKNDIYTKYSYLGEMYGTHNYLLAIKKRLDFIQKIKSNESIEVTLNHPVLGLMRGDKVNFIWYIMDDNTKYMMDGLIENGFGSKPESNIPLMEDEENENGSFIIDRTISAQYLITGCKIKYTQGGWKFILCLNRSNEQKQKMIND